MSLVGDIARSFVAPRRSMRVQIEAGITEEQTLFYAMLAGVLNLIAQTPALYRRSLTSEDAFAGLFAAQFVSSVFMLPLALLLLGGLTHLILKLFRGKADWRTARRAFVWPVLVASPFVLLSGVFNVLATNVVTNFAIAMVTAMVFVWQFCSCQAEAEFGEVRHGTE